MRSIPSPPAHPSRFHLAAAGLAVTLVTAMHPHPASLQAAPPDSLPPAIRDLDEAFRKLIDDGAIVAAQVVVGEGTHVAFSAAYGTLAPGSSRPANVDTLFLIGSTSKPFASACVMTLVDDPSLKIALGDPIERWLPAYAGATLDGGDPSSRSPTLKELLCHRAGIYSQKRRMTPQQTSLIRDFRRDLETAVDQIAAQPLIAQPGETYFYSGAGYCVLGRVAELASGESFETLLQERVCAPLGLVRTTYFPKRENENIAAGFGAASLPHALGENHRLPLIGGSLYSTAEEMAVFARAIFASKAGTEDDPLLTRDSVSATATRPFPGQTYGLGWALAFRKPGKTAQALSHSGALLSYRALIRVDLETGAHGAAVWTLRSKESESVAAEAIRAVFQAAVEAPVAEPES